MRFAVEGIPDAHRAGVTLQADDDRFDHRAIRALYESAEYPLTRQPRKAKPEGLQLVPSPAARAASAG